MPHKTDAAERIGGPGASHENRDKPPPEEKRATKPGAPTNQPFSHVSGGGGERDRHHGHSPEAKRDTEENSAQKKQL